MNEHIKLRALWERQQSFNDRIKAVKPSSQEYWAKQYLLGISSEIGEVLREIVWKDHRKATHTINRSNLGLELADLFKFTMCLFQLYDFSFEEALQLITDKTDEVERRYTHEFSTAADPNQLVVISDMDGTLCDWRKGFVQWLKPLIPDLRPDTLSFMDMERELGLDYKRYQVAKTAFENGGGYIDLPPIVRTLSAIQYLNKIGAVIHVFTARPQDTHSRIWMDSVRWLDKNGLGEIVRELHIGSTERIDFACSMRDQGHQVVMLEDDLALAVRASAAGIHVWMPAYPYNQNVATHHFIHRVPTIDGYHIWSTMYLGATS